MSFPVGAPLDLSSFGQVRDLQVLLEEAEPAIRRAFISSVVTAQTLADLDELIRLAETGRLAEAAVLVDSVAPEMLTAITAAYTAAGVNAAAVLTRDLNRFINFDQLNPLAVAHLQRTQLSLVRSISEDSRLTLEKILAEGMEQGLAPSAIARRARSSLGLTPEMYQFSANYRASLEAGSRRSLTRVLRDRRFDRTVQTALREGRALSPEQVDRMVVAYERQLLMNRAEGLALTEAQAAIHAGDEQLWMQAAGDALIDPSEVIGTWNTAGGERVRSSHAAMQGQRRPLGTPFRSGLGNNLRHPGDPGAPARDVVRCRCVVSRRLQVS